jgi:two-component system response regulator FixJ
MERADAIYSKRDFGENRVCAAPGSIESFYMLSDPIVYIVEDDAPVRRSMERLLSRANLTTVSYPTPKAFLEAAPTLDFGCVLLDIGLPGMDGLAVQARLIELGIILTIIIITGRGDVPTAVRAMKAGAIDFLEKPFADDALLNAIRRALTKNTVAAHAAGADQAARRIAALSPRERDVLDRLVSGRSNKIIAEELGLSIRTVEAHRGRMMVRLGVRQLAEAIGLAIIATLTGP